MRKETFTCDRCGAQKGDVNHWWMANALLSSVVFWPWRDEDASSPNFRHLCGQQCVIAELNQFMQGQSK